MSLGSTFQKINFLRDLNADYVGMGRTYFPGLDIVNFDDSEKKIEQATNADFGEGYKSIKQLLRTARFGVSVT